MIIDLIQNEVSPIPVQPKDTKTYVPTAEEMEAAVVKAAENGIQAKVLLVTNPGNPLGTLYPESTLKVNYSYLKVEVTFDGHTLLKQIKPDE